MTYEEAQEFVLQLSNTRFEDLISKINKANYLALVLFTAQVVYGDIPTDVEKVSIAQVMTGNYRSYSKELWGDISFQARMTRSPESLHFYDDYGRWYNSVASVYGKSLLKRSDIEEKETIVVNKEEVMEQLPKLEQPRTIKLSLNLDSVTERNNTSKESELYRRAKESVDRFTLSIGYTKEKLQSITGVFSDKEYYKKFNTMVFSENHRLAPPNMTQRQKDLYNKARKEVIAWYEQDDQVANI